MFTDEEKIKIINVKSLIGMKMSYIDELVAPYMGGTRSYFVSGGCIASLLQDEEPKDYDVYFRDSNLLGNIKVDIEKTKPNDVAVYEEKYREVTSLTGPLITENAITLKNKIQLILKHTGEPDDIRGTFDFVHCMPYWDSSDRKLHISKQQYDLIMQKMLHINNKHTVTQHRIDKFKQRNYVGPQQPWP
jgi:hypothetical protein